MEFFSDVFQYGYLANALAACVLSGIACGVIGTYVVCRRMVFLAGGITHASFGGLGIDVYKRQLLGALFPLRQQRGGAERLRPAALDRTSGPLRQERINNRIYEKGRFRRNRPFS